MADENSHSPEAGDEKPQRRWQHRWPVLIPILLVGGVLWVSLWFSRRSELLNSGGYVEFRAPTWGWLERLGGTDARSLFSSPTHLSVGIETPTATQWRIISGFSELQNLSVAGVTDERLQYLMDCPKLETLILLRSSLSDGGCADLSSLQNLKFLSIDNDQPLTQDGLKHLAALTQLTNTFIAAPGFSDRELAPLGNLQTLEFLDILDADITSDGLKHIAGLPRLRNLWLRKCRISPEAISSLRCSTSSLSLVLSGSTITDDHLEAISNVSCITSLVCDSTEVSRSACEAFAESHPGVTVYDADANPILVKPAEPDYSTLIEGANADP